MKLINLLIRELENCSLLGDFRVSCHAEICQFDRLSLEINFKRARSCNYGIPRLVQVKMKILYTWRILLTFITLSNKPFENLTCVGKLQFSLRVSYSNFLMLFLFFCLTCASRHYEPKEAHSKLCDATFHFISCKKLAITFPSERRDP